jgi:hypothetical protein
MSVKRKEETVGEIFGEWFNKLPVGSSQTSFTVNEFGNYAQEQILIHDPLTRYGFKKGRVLCSVDNVGRRLIGVRTCVGNVLFFEPFIDRQDIVISIVPKEIIDAGFFKNPQQITVEDFKVFRSQNHASNALIAILKRYRDKAKK